MNQENTNEPLSKTAVISGFFTDYNNYTIEEDKTGYAPKHLRFHFFSEDDEYAKGAGESIEECKIQIDELENDA